jgi:hypothetical protein
VTNQESCKLSRVINVRKLAAIDLYFLGPKIILTEFGLGVPIMLLLGILSLRVGLFRTHATWQIALGIYLLLLAVNYIPMLWCAIDIARSGSAAAELGDELRGKGAANAQVQRAVAVAAGAAGGTGSVAEAARRVTIIIGRNSARRYPAGLMF